MSKKTAINPRFTTLLASLVAFLSLTGCNDNGNYGTQEDGRTTSVVNLAEGARVGGDLPLAAKMYREAISQDPHNTTYMVGLGRILLEDGNSDDAVHIFSKAIKADEESAAAYKGRGKAYLNLNLPGKAQTDFDKAINLNPNDKNAFVGRGVALDSQGAHEEAQESYRKALELDPTDMNAKNNLGLSLALDKQYTRSIEVLRRVAKNSAAMPRHRQNLALAVALSGDYSSARDILSMDLDKASIQDFLSYVQTINSITDKREKATTILSGGIKAMKPANPMREERPAYFDGYPVEEEATEEAQGDEMAEMGAQYAMIDPDTPLGAGSKGTAKAGSDLPPGGVDIVVQNTDAFGGGAPEGLTKVDSPSTPSGNDYTARSSSWTAAPIPRPSSSSGFAPAPTDESIISEGASQVAFDGEKLESGTPEDLEKITVYEVTDGGNLDRISETIESKRTAGSTSSHWPSERMMPQGMRSK